MSLPSLSSARSPRQPSVGFSLLLIFGVVLALVPAPPASGGVDRWTPTGPDLGAVRRVVAEDDGHTVWAIGTGVLFRSADGGATWASVGRGLEDHGLASLAADPWRPDTVWAATFGGVRRSDDYGLTWVTKNVGLLNPSVRKVVVDPNDRDGLWAATVSRIFRSTDLGESWTGSVGGPSDPFDLIADPAVPGRLWAASNGQPDNFWRSDDGGVTWLDRDPGLEGTLATSVAVDPGDPDRVWVGFFTGQVYRSEDGGATWTRQHEGIVGGPVSLVTLPTPPTTLLVATLGEVYESTDLGVSLVATGYPDGTLLQHLSVGSGAIWGSSLAGIFRRSFDGAGGWQRHDRFYAAYSPSDLAIVPGSGELVMTSFAASEGLPAIFRGEAGDWQDISADFPAPFAAAVVAGPGPQEDLLMATNGPDGQELFRSTGAGWQDVGPGPPGLVGAFDVDPHRPSVRWAITVPGVYRSADGGATWSERSDGLPRECCPILELVVDPRPSDVLYAVVEREGVFKSVDEGLSWAAAREGLFLDVLALGLDPRSPDTLYAAASDGAVYRTDDGATSWSEVGSLPGVPVRLLVDPRPGHSTVFAATLDNGVQVSDDRGATWRGLNEGLEWGRVTDLVPEIEDGVLTLHLLGLGNGLYSRTFSERTLAASPDFSFSPPEPRAGDLVSFADLTGGLPPDARHTWDFGDGVSSDGPSPVHAFPAAGTWPVTLAVGVGDQAASVTRQVRVTGDAVPSTCEPSDSVVCLRDGRFRVSVEWADFQGGRGVGTKVTQSDDSALFWFFRPANWELMVKVLDGCAVNDHLWVFSAATTNVEYTLRVEDTASGEDWEYRNPSGIPSPAVTDTGAFATCP